MISLCPAPLPQTLYNFGQTAKPFCSYRMSDELAESLGIADEVAEVGHDAAADTF